MCSMVFESLLNYNAVKRHWLFVFMLGFLFSTFAVFMSMFIFPTETSLVMVFLTVFAVFYFFYTQIKTEEYNDKVIEDELPLLKAHARTVFLFLLLFIGFLTSYTFWALVLPHDVSNQVFSVQLETIGALNGQISGAFFSDSYLGAIFANNVKVLVFCLLFSFLYGAGAVFILTWNASVGGAFLGTFIREKMVHFTTAHALLLGAFRYLPHGLIEMAAYFVGGLAGGIISVAIINRDFSKGTFTKILFDASQLVFVALGLLFVAAFVEVYFTPAIVAAFA